VKRSERTCCVCRSKGGKQELARLVFFEGGLVWDELQRAPGRGAYVHLKPDCLSKMGQAVRWERALRLTAGALRSTQFGELTRSMLGKVVSRGE
jgi:predicted RNA-binding protein YlxR (DUF448 family)